MPETNRLLWELAEATTATAGLMVLQGPEITYLACTPKHDQAAQEAIDTRLSFVVRPAGRLRRVGHWYQRVTHPLSPYRGAAEDEIIRFLCAFFQAVYYTQDWLYNNCCTPSRTRLVAPMVPTSSLKLDGDTHDFQKQFVHGIRAGHIGSIRCTAAGKVLLAHAMPAAKTDEILATAELARHGSQSPVCKRMLIGELAGIRDGYIATDDQESAPGLIGIAAPIFDAERKAIAALELYTSTSRHTLRELKERSELDLQRAVEKISSPLAATKLRSGSTISCCSEVCHHLRFPLIKRMAFKLTVRVLRLVRWVTPRRLTHGWNTRFFDMVGETERWRIEHGKPTPELWPREYERSQTHEAGPDMCEFALLDCPSSDASIPTYTGGVGRPSPRRSLSVLVATMAATARAVGPPGKEGSSGKTGTPLPFLRRDASDRTDTPSGARSH